MDTAPHETVVPAAVVDHDDTSLGWDDVSIGVDDEEVSVDTTDSVDTDDVDTDDAVDTDGNVSTVRGRPESRSTTARKITP